MSEKEVDKTKSDLSLFGEADPLVGKIVEGKWQIIDFLGEGSISTVYLARARDAGNRCILKHIPKHLTEGIWTLKKFRQRLNNLADSLKGKNVLQYQEIHVADDKQVWLVLDNVDFESLEDLLSKSGHIAIERAASLFKQVCNGLSEGEAAGFQHRDLKPSNIIIINDEKFTDDVRLTDFGIAQILTEETESNSSSQYITHTGKVFGSPLYLSPEQCTGKRLDQRSDIYSLGCVMYETLIG
ncbi:MAG TPA: serine/threonine-protein kinase, partial [Candidatus Melainabacteria bacterium]|nr:serine/threonine-protein kinase [Candidatus Melainabacteria bacterium]